MNIQFSGARVWQMHAGKWESPTCIYTYIVIVPSSGQLSRLTHTQNYYLLNINKAIQFYTHVYLQQDNFGVPVLCTWSKTIQSQCWWWGIVFYFFSISSPGCCELVTSKQQWVHYSPWDSHSYPSLFYVDIFSEADCWHIIVKVRHDFNHFIPLVFIFG